jgi:CelD/BcsL family acetyltransferase involved in cellulose biosynthesis
LKRRRKVLHDKFGIRNVKGDPITSKEAIRDLFFLHNLRAQSKQMETSFHGEDSIQFHEEVSRLFFRNGWLRLRFLLNREKRIAALYSFAFSNRLFAYQSGLDPEWETRGAGSALLYDLIEEAFKDQMNEFDFLRGGEPYKGTWTKESRTLFNVNIYNFTLWGRFCKSAFRARRVIKTIFGKKV